MEPQQYVFIVVLLIVGLAYDRARAARKKASSRAHEKVIELRLKGINASVCPICDGTGDRAGIITRSCDRCNGIGYIYTIPEDDSESDE